MDSSVYVSGVIARLGFTDEGEYKPDPDCFYGIRELIQLLRSDDKFFTTRREILGHNIVKNDLVKIMVKRNIETQLFDAALRLTVNLLTPAYMLGDIRDIEDRQHYALILREVDDVLLQSLSAFANDEFFAVIKRKVESYVSKADDDISEEDKINVERLLALLRHIFMVGATVIPCYTINKVDKSVENKVVLHYLKSGVDDIIIEFALKQKSTEFVLPVFSLHALIVNRFEANDVAKSTDIALASASQPKKNALTPDEQKKLTRLATNPAMQHRPSGRTFLGGIYAVQGLKALNNKKDFVVTKPINNDDLMKSFNERKGVKPIARNRRIAEKVIETVNSTVVSNVILFEVKKFVEKILAFSFKKLMRYAMDSAFDSTRPLSYAYADRYFFVLNIFMFQFCRAVSREDFQKSLLLNKEFAHMLMTKIDYYFDMMKTDKEKVKKYIADAEYAVTCFESMVIYLKFLGDNLKSDNDDIYQDICSYMFEMQECREMTVNIMNALSVTTVSFPILHSLIIMNEYYMFLMDRENKRGKLRQVKVRRKIRARKSKLKSADANGEEIDTTPELVKDVQAYSKKYSKEELEEIWKEISIDLEDVINGIVDVPECDISVIDYSVPAKDEVERQMFAILKIRRALREKRHNEAVTLFKAAQAFWSNEGDAFAGEMKLSSFQEFMFLDNMDEALDSFKTAVDSIYAEPEKNENIDNDIEEVEEHSQYLDTVDFNLPEFISKLASNSVLHWYIVVLEHYKTNSDHVNMAILKFFKRIWKDLNSAARLFDVRLFYIFDEVGKLSKTMTHDEMKAQRVEALYQFAEKFSAEFFKHLATGGSVLINELWTAKTAREVYEIQEGYNAYDPTTGKGDQWPEELEKELLSLYKEYMDMEDKPDSITVLDFIGSNLSQQREEKQIAKKLRQLGYNVKRSKKPTAVDLLLEDSQKLSTLAQAYNELSEKEGDLVSYIQTRLSKKYSRPRLIKVLHYRGFKVENPSTKSKKIKPTEWLHDSDIEDNETDKELSDLSVKESDDQNGSAKSSDETRLIDDQLREE